MTLSLIPAIFIFFGILSIAYAVPLFFYFSKQSNRAIENFAIASLLIGISAIVTVFRAEIPVSISYIGANALAFISYRYGNYSLINLVGDQPHLRPTARRNLIVFLLYVIALYWIGILLDARYQTVFVSICTAYLLLEGTYLSIKIYKKTKIDLIKIYAWLLAISCALWLGRIFLAVFDFATMAFDTGLANTVIFVGIFLTATFRYIIFPIFLLKQAENEKETLLINRLVWANKTAASGALSASLAHELSQPLSAIQLNSEFMKLQLSQGRPDQALLNDLAEKIVADNLRAGSIIQSLRSVFNSEQANLAPFELNTIVETILQITGPDLTNNNINLTLSLGAHTTVRINAPEIQQVVLNIINNAGQALGLVERDVKEITIKTTLADNQVILTIADNGPGVPVERKHTLFELGSQNKRTGMGLGLWLCKLILNRNFGTIRYDDAPTGGAIFTVILPSAAQ